MNRVGKWTTSVAASLVLACCAVGAGAAQPAGASASGGTLLGVDPPPGMDRLEHTRRLGEELGTSGLRQRMPEMKEFFDYGDQVVLPNVYGRGGLDFHDRELVVIATIIAQSTPLGLDWHFRDLAWRAGISEREVQEVIFTACLYGGWPKCATANNAWRKVMDAPNDWPADLRTKRAEK